MKQISLVQKLRHFLKHSRLIINNVSVLPRVVRGYFRTLVLKKNTLRTLELTVTPECNVNCEMCYATKIHQKGKEYLTPDEYRELWKQAKKMGAFSVVISGGEPTMRNDLFEIIAALEPGKTLIGIVSNSTRLNREYLQKLFDAGVSVLHLSLNSVDEEQNDKERDFKGHFQRVNEIVDIAKEIGFQVLFSTVVAHDSMENTKQVVEFAKSRGVGVVFSLACPTGNWEGALDCLLTPEEWDKADDYMTDNPYIRSDWTINYSMKKECPGGREKVCISPYGDYMGCGMNFISLGNIRKESLETIWKRACEWAPFKQKANKCLIAVDQNYLDEYLLPIVGNESLPVQIDKHPKHPMKLPEVYDE